MVGVDAAGREDPAPHDPDYELAQRERVAAADGAAAAERDAAAKSADVLAASRDRAADKRDRVADSVAAAPAGTIREQAASDRQAAARDRHEAYRDRWRSRRDRVTAGLGRQRATDDRKAAMDALAYLRSLSDLAESNGEDMLLIGQAQGKIMEAEGMKAAEALIEIFAYAVRDGIELAPAARRILSVRVAQDRD